MKIDSLFIAIAIVIAAIIGGFIGNSYVTNVKVFQTKQARDMAVDGCMQNARYIWQEPNKDKTELVNTTEEPNRYWYRLCMQEKGYEVVAEI